MSSSTQRKWNPGDWCTISFRLLRVVLLPLLMVLLLLMIFEESLIFFPYRYDGSSAWTPAGLRYEDVYFSADDGTRLHGWYCGTDAPRAVILYTHGNAGNITHRIEVARQLQSMGLAFLMFDYRGYGRSDQKKPNEQGILADARAARKELARLAGVAESEIVLMGRSIGGAVAVDLAAGSGARALVVESSFSSLPDVAAVHYRWLPVRLFMRTRLDSISKIGKYEGPFLQSHGGQDDTIPIRLGRQLFDASRPRNGCDKQFFVVEGGDHNDPQPMAYYRVLDAFINTLP